MELALAGNGARIRVDDQGPGVAAAHRERIFDRFFSHRPGDPKCQHAGLGLAIARARVRPPRAPSRH